MAAAAGVSVFLGVALGVALGFLGVAAFLALGAGFFFCTAPAVLACPLVMRPEAVLAEILVSSTMAGAWCGSVSVPYGTGVEGLRHTIAGVFFTRLVDVLALAAFALGAAFAFVALVVDAFFGAAFVVVFASVFFGLPAVLVPAGFVALVAFYEELAVILYESQGRQRYLGSRFLFFGGRGRFCDGFLLGQLHCARWTCVAISAEHSSL